MSTFLASAIVFNVRSVKTHIRQVFASRYTHSTGTTNEDLFVIMSITERSRISYISRITSTHNK